MTGERARPDILIRPDGQVERLDLPEPATLTGTYAPMVPLHLRGRMRAAQERRTRSRFPEHILRGRLIDILG